MARYDEVAAGTFGHTIRIRTDIDLSTDSPDLHMDVRAPDETTVTRKTAAIDPADATNKTMKYVTIDGDLGDDEDEATFGEYRIVGIVDYGAAGYHKGRPAVKVIAADPWS